VQNTRLLADRQQSDTCFVAFGKSLRIWVLGIVPAPPVEGDGKGTLALGEEVEQVNALADLRTELHELEGLGWLNEDDLPAFILLSLGDDVLCAVRCATSGLDGLRGVIDLRSRGE
jgi:hypothetical protein